MDDSYINVSQWLKKKKNSEKWKSFWDKKYINFIGKQASKFSTDPKFAKDLMIDGFLGAISAMDKYDINKGAQFGTFLWYHTNNKIMKSLDKKIQYDKKIKPFDPIYKIQIQEKYQNKIGLIKTKLYSIINHLINITQDKEVINGLQYLIDKFYHNLKLTDLLEKYKINKDQSYYITKKTFALIKGFIQKNPQYLTDIAEITD